MIKGHVFLLLADLADVAHDALVLPADHPFETAQQWRAVAESIQKPSGFNAHHFGRSGHSKVWWVERTDGGAGSEAARLQHLTDCLADIAATLGKPLARVALPVLGQDGHEEFGLTQHDLLDALRKSAEHHQLDILLTTTDVRQFQALQDARLPDPQRWFPGFAASGRAEALTLDSARRLGTRARKKDLSIFLGSGVSVGAGLPDRSGLLADLVAGTKLPESLTAEQISALSLPDQAELLQHHDPRFTLRLADRVRRVDRPGLAHLLLAALHVQQSATTNYDELYERAVRSADPERRLAVLPYERRTDGRPWLLKMHGDASHPGDIVLSRSQACTDDSRHHPAGVLFEAMLLTSHLLVVGASPADDDVLGLVRRVRGFLPPTSGDNRLGTVLTLRPEPARAALWADELDWVSVDREDDEPSRVLEIFLDAVVMHGYAESTSLLDEHFEDQLASEPERDLARRLRSIAGEVEKQTGHAWKGLKTSLGL